MTSRANLYALLLLALVAWSCGTVYVKITPWLPPVDEYRMEVESGLSARCCANFPFLEGWLGGDGDVSVPLDAVTTLFFFSDTYVGRQEQQSRHEAGLQMVANTVAVQTCHSSEQAEIHYFWNRMYTTSPQAVFVPTEARHKFWVNDAFMIDGSLFVLLEEIGPKPDAAPDEIFNFTQMGYTMAMIRNPYAAPFLWEIEYIPLPDFVAPQLGIGCHAREDKYLYFFINHNDDAQFLMRKPLLHFEDMEIPFEYYSDKGRWKKELHVEEMDTIVAGFRCNTVKYHPDLKLWIMVHDIWFRTNEIKIRTASELTGPWSDEKVVYTIPETTKGDPLYKATNFCYLARECIQNYDAINHELVITYDVNNSDLAEVLNDDAIYRPRVIKVALPEEE